METDVRDNPDQKLLQMEDLARDLHLCEGDLILSEDHILLKFVNALLHEYNIRKRLLEDRDGRRSREVGITSVLKCFESAISKQGILRERI